jgi:hypothetical protein
MTSGRSSDDQWRFHRMSIPRPEELLPKDIAGLVSRCRQYD